MSNEIVTPEQTVSTKKHKEHAKRLDFSVERGTSVHREQKSGFLEKQGEKNSWTVSMHVNPTDKMHVLGRLDPKIGAMIAIPIGKSLIRNKKAVKMSTDCIGDNLVGTPGLETRDFDKVSDFLYTHWDRSRLREFKEMKILYVGKDKKAFAFADVPENSANIPLDLPANMFYVDVPKIIKCADEINASSIIVAESCYRTELTAQLSDSFRLAIYKQFSDVGKEYKIKIDDYYSVAATSVSSLKHRKIIP